MSSVQILYATDEDLAIRAPTDFGLLSPRDQKLASGIDGVFDPADRWTMRSLTVDFAAQGVTTGQVVQLIGPVNLFKPPGELLAVASVSPGAVTLRRKGQPAGMGQPPAPAAGLTGVEFLITTLGPQIERASYELDRRYGIDDLVAGHRAADLYDAREVREVVVLTVLQRQYLAMSRDVSSSQDTLAAKAGLLQAELDELLARVVVHWTVGGTPAATTRFQTRIAR